MRKETVNFGFVSGVFSVASFEQFVWYSCLQTEVLTFLSDLEFLSAALIYEAALKIFR